MQNQGRSDAESVHFTRAIVRAFGDEPLLRYAALSEDGVVMVRSERSYRAWEAGEERNNWIGWPMRDVFKYEEQSLKLLQQLFSQHQDEKLRQAWEVQQSMFA